MQVDRIDLIQMHNLTQADQWETAMGPGGALEALVEAKEQGLVRFLGVTGHGTYAPAMHGKVWGLCLRFDSGALQLHHDADLKPRFRGALRHVPDSGRRHANHQGHCGPALARGRRGKAFSWYRPITDPEAMKRAGCPVSREPFYQHQQ